MGKYNKVEKHRKEIEKGYEDAGMPINYDAELSGMKEKLRKLK